MSLFLGSASQQAQPTESSAYPLDADNAEYSSAGAVPLVITDGFQTVSYPFDGTGNEKAAMPTGYTEGSARKIDFAGKKIAFELHFQSFPDVNNVNSFCALRIKVNSSYSQAAAASLSFVEIRLHNDYSVIDGENTIFGAGIDRRSPVVGFYYDGTLGSSSTIGLVLDGVDQGAFFNFDPAEESSISLSSHYYIEPGDDGAIDNPLTVRLVTEADEMTQTYPAGFTTIGGEAVPAA